jgi:SAM-dependent methyltransferase
MALASAVLGVTGDRGPLEDWVVARPSLKILEINRAGDLTPWLARLPNHRLVEFPDVDLESLPFADGEWDAIVHSDTLEHVDDPVKALMECRRVLAPGGRLCFTIPIVPGRLTRRRDGMAPSYHGSEQDPAYRVVTEYGADFWSSVLQAGFCELRIIVERWPDALALVASRR